MKQARIELILEVSDSDPRAIEDLVDFERAIKAGEFQRDFTKAGARKATATFEWLKK